jgi:hypothetical protein
MPKTIAERWLNKIDNPSPATPSGISHDAVERMKDAAEDVIQCASPRYTDLYIFEDGSGLWEKRKDDWFIADEDTIARARSEGGEND